LGSWTTRLQPVIRCALAIGRSTPSSSGGSRVWPRHLPISRRSPPLWRRTPSSRLVLRQVQTQPCRTTRPSGAPRKRPRAPPLHLLV
jgi:hypothetical protein